MKLRKLLALSLTTVLCFGTAITTKAAELDCEWYAAKNPDVVAEVGDSPEALRRHYETFGKKEARMANENDTESQLRKFFNAKEYAALYSDVKEAFGDDEEAMFQHYISYGLLETRRPCDKVSYEAAVSLKNTVVKELEKAGLPATPGLAPIGSIIGGSISKTAGGAVTEQIMTQVTAAVDKAIENTIDEANNPPSKSSGSVASSSGSSAGGSTSGDGGEGEGEGEGGGSDSGTTPTPGDSSTGSDGTPEEVDSK